MEIFYSKDAVKTIKSMDKSTKQRIKKAIEEIPSGDIKPLRGTGSLYRLRVGGWRIVFAFPEENNLLIVKVAPRGDVYKGGF